MDCSEPSVKTDGKRTRGEALTPAQKEIIYRCVRDAGEKDKMGYKAILKRYPEMGFTEQGLKAACRRLKDTGTLDRKSGSGPKRARRTPDVVDDMRQFLADNRTATCGDAARALKLPRSTARRAILEDLQLKPIRQVTAQRVKPVNMAKRLEACQKWNDQIQPGELDVAKIYFTDEKLFRLGACAGGNQNFVVYVSRETKKSQVPDDLILREDGRWQGGVSVMVCLGLCHRGKGRLHFVPAGTKVNSAEYLNIVKNIYEPNIHHYYGIRPDCVFQQDGASSHTANAVQEYCKRKFQKFWAEGEWPPNSPDLNPLDYFCWGYLQQEVTKRKPTCLDSLKLAIMQSVGDMPADMAQRAIEGFGKRVRMCIRSEGGTFKHRQLEEAEGEALYYPIVDGPEDIGDEQQDREE